jgi:catechol-2,3-dioxygenase
VRIDRVRIAVGGAAGAARFFSEVLELPVEPEGPSQRVTVGRSRLLLSEAPNPAPAVHHLAFDVPPGAFDEHRAWLAARVPLLADADGATEFEGPPGWNSRSVYFEGPDRMVLELIARRNRAAETTSPTPHLGSVNEVGVAVADVPAAVARLHRAWGLEPFNGTSAEFAPVGDEEGLLILVAPGRPWYPTRDVTAGPLPLTVELAVDGPGALTLEPLASLRATSPPQ